MAKYVSIREVPESLRTDKITAPNGDLKSWKEVLESDPNYKVLVDDEGNLVTNKKKTPEENYRKNLARSMANPANPYSAALGWIGANYSAIPGTLGITIAPAITVAGIAGDIVGLRIGNKVSDKLLSNPDLKHKLNTDITITPRQTLLHGMGLITSGGAARFMRWGLAPQTIIGTENIVTKRPFSLKVNKQSVIPPEEMVTRNNTPTFLKSKYKGLTEDGLYEYELPKAFMLIPTKLAMRNIALRMAKNNYFPTEVEGLEGPAFFNIVKDLVVNDYGKTGAGLIGFSILNWKPGFYTVDAAVLPTLEFFMSLKKGGKLNGGK